MFESDAVPMPQTVAPTLPLAARIKQFIEMKRKFEVGTKWVNRGYVDRRWTAESHGVDPRFETDIKDFETKVVEPMDKLWAQMTEDERKAADADY